jgi:hypothetical protein
MWDGRQVPVLAFADGADPQDPVGNLPGLRQHFPDSRTVTFPHLGHEWADIAGCFDQIVTDFVDRGTRSATERPQVCGVLRTPGGS